MNLGELQAELRHFAAQRDWQPFHTPKNLATALMVEAAELAEIFQWITPEASVAAHEDAASKARIGAEVADVLLYLLQVADHRRVDLTHAVRDKLARNADKYPAKHVIARVSPTRASVPGTHVLLDHENVRPTEEQVRAPVPDARQLWVFRGPHQRDVEQRFASFGSGATVVPISKMGKNVLDFHLSFYMGYIASRNPGAVMVVIANDKGYEPMLEHARAKAAPAAKKVAASPAVAKPTAAKKAAAKEAAPKKTPAPTAAAKHSVAALKAAFVAPGAAAAKPAAFAPDSPVTIRRLADHLRKMGDKRPTKPASLWRSLKSFLGKDATDEAVEAALSRLIAEGVVKVDSVKGASYPGGRSGPGFGGRPGLIRCRGGRCTLRR